MTDDDPTTPPRGQPRVVKKVVRRTVVRPAPTSRSSVSRTSRPVGPKPEKSPDADSTASVPKRPTVNLGSVRQTSKQWSAKGTQSAAAGLGGLRRAGSAARRFVADRYWDVREYRLPPQPPLRSAAVVGLLLGLLAVVVGWLSGLVFTQVRGTSSGGGLWGGLVVVSLAVFTVWAGARLLRTLTVENAGTVSLLAVFLVLIAILLFFIDLASGPWAWLVVPLLVSASYAVALVLTALVTADVEETA
ncbi:hypothetical protein [Aeromicrobium sp. CTD01-1L150]|uniref:hypothetical protein n=1 Tax=Aeromicrobium sp. CTD01-1L150 TaxID=3341830 RepID=UPI0035C054EC